jgi:hypothetical protein
MDIIVDHQLLHEVEEYEIKKQVYETMSAHVCAAWGKDLG